MKKFFLATLLLLAFVSPLTRADELDELLVLNRPVPRDAKDLRVIEHAATKIAALVVQCTVGVQVGNNHGSGVVISDSGYVLTAAHVTERPGRKATIRFPDGTTVSGKTLGLHTQADGALIKITDEGSWPFMPVVTLDDYPYPKPGDWCLATGHPGGFDADRTPPVRLGRIIDVNETVIRTDCAINSGDSGGPLFDMQGRVIGIHSRIAEHATINLHGPVLAYQESWQQMKDGEVYPPRPESRFFDKLDIDRDGKITRAELPAGIYQQMYDRLAEKYELNDEAGYTIGELKRLVGWQHVPSSFEIPPYDLDTPSDHALARERFVRGRDVRTVFASLASDVQKSIVEVQCEGKRVALGTVVEGGVLTKASQLEENVTCKTHDGRVLTARVAHVDSAQDLALLKLDEQLDAISLPTDANVSLGSWLITPGLNGRPISIGVSSVAGRSIAVRPGVLGVAIASTGSGAIITGVLEKSGAAAAGLLVDDVIVKVMATEVHTFEELQAALASYRAGRIVKTTVMRNGNPLEFDVCLGMREEVFPMEVQPGVKLLNGELSFRRDDFPTAFQHDSVLQPKDCGGPVTDVSGRVVGINIARADRVATYALPIQVVQEVLTRFNTEGAAASDE